MFKMAEKLLVAAERSVFSSLLGSTPTPEGVYFSRTSVGGVPVAWVLPKEHAPRQLLYYVHGGGYSWGSIDSHLPFAAQIARSVGCRALIVDYRRAPEHPFPAALEDVSAVYHWLRHREPDSRIAIAGESAGAGLALSTIMSEECRGTPPVASFLLSPWVDLHGEATSGSGGAYRKKIIARYANGVDTRDSRISPIYGDLSQLPPTLIHAGDKELLARDAQILADRMQQQGVAVTFEQYPGRMHALHTFVHLSSHARQFLDRAAHFLTRELAQEAME